MNHFSLAFDVGTTNLDGRLYPAAGDSPAAVIRERNAQRRWGADIISRIQFANTNDAQGALLQRTLLTQIAQMTTSLLAQAGGGVVDRAVLVGNTAMLHFLCGLSVKGLGAAPFAPSSFFGSHITWGELWGAPDQTAAIPPEARVFIPPCTGAFTGADLTAALTTLENRKGIDAPFFLADLGTNCEVAFHGAGQEGTILAASAAAGPAFEGGAVSMDLPGSALVTALAAALDNGRIDRTGRLAPQAADGGSGFTQGDVRALQLAKAAVCAALAILAGEAGDPSLRDAPLYLCGAFGDAIVPAAAARIGLVPARFMGRVIPTGNAALDGAALMLGDGDAQQAAMCIAGRTRPVELAADPRFPKAFMDALDFSENL
ncbi:MAG: ASKHA domain-containing protein [Spirochaetaceae bacterium]|jgi:uncharacterized 2Fe-2S/4Fe-4S cluster protein (DUF4445 family)|nr:ASKHA domain-containing protein [Spirochaetaceae bacterium]